MLQLVFPNEQYKESWEHVIKNWKGFKMPSYFFSYSNFEDFLEGIKKDIKGVEGKVPSHMFFMIDTEFKNEIIGIVQIRHHINHPNLIEDGGHIGYGIYQNFRKKGYGTQLLQLSLEKIKELGLTIPKVLISCNADNIGSAKVIENNGGIFERLSENGKKRYWINL